MPPKDYGGTELFIAQLAVGLKARGIEVVLYANGESTSPVETRHLYERSEWPLLHDVDGSLKDVNHSSWAMHDAATTGCDLIHVNSAPALAMSHFVRQPVVYTVHHPEEPQLSDFYRYYSQVNFVCISEFQRSLQALPHSITIHHGIDLSRYPLVEQKQQYLTFLGRIAPVKGTHLAIEVAKKSGIPLKIAGEIQPIFQSYFESQVKPHIDGRLIEYVGQVGPQEKSELLGNSLAMLFPIQWNEPFGLVMVEAMACGTPVLALPGGSVAEVVRPGVSGWVCASVDEMAARAHQLQFDAAAIRAYVENNFSVEIMVDHYIALYERLIAGAAARKIPESAVA